MKTKEEILKLFTSEEDVWWAYREGIQEGYNEAFNSLRDQASIAAMQAQVSSFETMEKFVSILKERGDEKAEALETLVAMRSVAYADALIAELRKNGWL